ncbi:MAG: CcmD family protein [Dehalococcoidia bacterium]|nr:CcmD family protein [Dehalococcoidia bacterium]MDZ4247210.1 CcmD family protein [Dehalococcoidia bacterium]
MENAAYLFTAYAIVWAVVFGFILVLFNRQKKLRQEISSLKELLQEIQPGNKS